MDGKDYQESRPLAEGSDLGEIDDIDIDSLCHGKDTTKQKSLRNLYLILMIVLVVMSSICSGLLGAYFGKRTRDLDTICAAYTTQYCESWSMSLNNLAQLTNVQFSTSYQGDENRILSCQVQWHIYARGHLPPNRFRRGGCRLGSLGCRL